MRLCARLQEVPRLYVEAITVGCVCVWEGGEEKRRQGEARLGMSWRGKTGQARARQENTRQDQARQVKGKDGKKRRGKARAIQPDPEASYNSKH